MKKHLKIQAGVALVLSALTVSISVGSAQTCTVDWNTVYQRIDGFGASSAWRSSWSTTLGNLFFSTNNGIVYTDTLSNTTTNNGIGLSLLRNHIIPSYVTASYGIPFTAEQAIMQSAQTNGARIWSTPWTPPSGFKNTGVLDGGNYLGYGNDATNLIYAQQLANYVSYMNSQYGITNIYALSIQNEPDGNHPDPNGYESCVWNSTQIHDFVTNLYAAMLAQNETSTLIMLPESQNWQDPGYASTAMNDTNVAPYVGIIADHNYDGTDGPTPLTHPNYGKALWETEVSLLSGSDSSITNGVYWAQRMYLFMTVAQANAYHYWWLISGSSSGGNEGLLDNNGSITKRFFTFGQYSRFVRPNYYRIDAANTGSALISAYKDSASPAFAIVAVNTNYVPVSQTFNLTNFTAVSVTPWLTTSNLSLAGTNAIPVSASSFTYTLPALSVVTFVGQAYTNEVNIAPVLAPVADQVVNAGVTLLITNAVTDPNVPPFALAFGLLSGPTNATLTPLDATDELLTWRPLVSQANTTNAVSVQVTDGGTGFSATNSFNVIVNPLSAQPVLSSISASRGQIISLGMNGPQGPDYTVWTSTNLVNWQVLLTTNSPATPLTLVVTNLNDRSRFYRIQIGP